MILQERLAVAAVNGLALVLLAASSCLLNEVLALFGKSIAEIAAAAETHLSEHFLDVRLDDHRKKGERNEVDVRILRRSKSLAQVPSDAVQGH